MQKKNPVRVLLVLVILMASLCTGPGYAQYNADSADWWVKRLEDKGEVGNDAYAELARTVDPSQYGFLQQTFREKGDMSNLYFLTRYYLFSARVAYEKTYPTPNDSVQIFFSQALRTAYEVDDEKLICAASWSFGELMDNYGETELAVMYCLNAAELAKKTGVRFTGLQFWKLSEVFYRIREYEQSIFYGKQAAEKMRDHFWLANCVNTIALGYQKLGKYDSAILYYDSANLFTSNFKSGKIQFGESDSVSVLRANRDLIVELWKGIISGNKAQVYFLQGKYQAALPLFELDYQRSKDVELFDNAANSLQWAAKTNLMLGNNATALVQVREAFQLLVQSPVRNYYQNLYNTATDVYRAANMPDSVFYFSRRYQALHDSIESEVASSRLEIARVKLENERNYYDIRNFQQQRKQEFTKRNIIIIGILLLAIIVILYMNNLRVKSFHRQQLTAEKNRNAKIEIAAAREQLESFTASLVEKSNIIEQLQQQLNDTTLSSAQHEALSSVLQSTIITEDQWIAFKNLLEKIYPGFFHRLKETYPGITVAEQRMAALSKLKLSTKETSSMLGISIESVHKTRQRLKQRLNLAAEVKLEEYIAAF